MFTKITIYNCKTDYFIRYNLGQEQTFSRPKQLLPDHVYLEIENICKNLEDFNILQGHFIDCRKYKVEQNPGGDLPPFLKLSRNLVALHRKLPKTSRKCQKDQIKHFKSCQKQAESAKKPKIPDFKHFIQ